MGIICQVKGSNGSGKSSLIRALIALSKDKYYLVRDNKIYATILADLQWCVVGDYTGEGNFGGCDGIHTMAELKIIVLELTESFPGYYQIMEGMMISTTMTMYYYFLELQKNYNIVPFIVVLKATPEGCLKRIEQRRGSPLERTDLVAQKCELVLKHKYAPEHVAYLDVDNVSKADMLPTFLKLIGDALTLNDHFPTC